MGNSKRAGGFSSLTTGIGSDLKGGSSFNASANGNTEDNRFSYSITESTTRYDDTLNQLSGYGSYNGPHGPLVSFRLRPQMTVHDNILPAIAAGLFCTPVA